MESLVNKMENNVLENLFRSGSQDDIRKFIGEFSSSPDLIRWMKTRPTGNVNVIEVKGNKDIAVIIPTANASGKIARNCQDTIFKGLSIFFVESGINDPYFNYARSCNRGIEAAKEKGFRWIIVSNDDMIAIDPVSKLMSGLGDIEEHSVIFTKPYGKYHSYQVKVGKRSNLKLLYHLTHGYGGLSLYKLEVEIQKKFQSLYTLENMSIWHRFFNHETVRFVNIGSFGIFNSNFLEKRSWKLFDETYINGIEDADLSLSIRKDKIDFGFMNFRIGDMIGSSLGGYSDNRLTRDFINLVYFNSKHAGYLSQMSK